MQNLHSCIKLPGCNVKNKRVEKTKYLQLSHLPNFHNSVNPSAENNLQQL